MGISYERIQKFKKIPLIVNTLAAG